MKEKGIRAKVTRKTRPPVSPHLIHYWIFSCGVMWTTMSVQRISAIDIICKVEFTLLY
jgi:hypothetical protein